MMALRDAVGAAILGGAFLGLLAAAELWTRRGAPNPEWPRKLVHLGGGIVCVFFPFLVRSPWVVLAMAAGLSALFALGAKGGRLRSLHGVARLSRGSEYYPLAIFLVFLLAGDRPWLYVSSVLVLAVADALAALIGGAYGVIRYEVEDERKSLEGSLVFLVVAFLAVHLPLLLMTSLPRESTVLAALLVAGLVTAFEAIALRGADNLFVPLAVCVVLGKITTKPTAEIAYQNLSFAAICIGVALTAWRTRSFNVGGTLTLILFSYAAWSLGSARWALPVFLGVGLYTLAWLATRGPARRAGALKVRVLYRALLVPFGILVAGNATGRYGEAFGPYLTACTAVLTFSLWRHALAARPVTGGRRAVAALATGVLCAAAVAGISTGITAGTSLRALAAMASVCVPLAAVNDALLRRETGTKTGHRWTAAQFVLTCAAAGAVFAAQTAGWIPAWPSE